MKKLSRLVFGLALLAAPALVGCGEESKPAADTSAPAPAAPATPPADAKTPGK
jgi:hypothetical protein